MKRSRQDKEQTHQRIVENAAQQIRAEGVNGVGIAELMGQAGLTHGGFYAHFHNKDALLAEICHAGMAETIEGLSQAVAHAPAGVKVAALVTRYLNMDHRDNPSHGCVMPSLAADFSRRPEEVRSAFTEEYEKLLQLVASVLPERSAEKRDDAAIALVSGMVGALLLARTVNDSALSERILRTTRDFLIQTFSKISSEND